MKPLILASQSPRRKQLLEQVQIPFSIVSSQIEEKMNHELSPEELVLSLAAQKAEAVYRDHEDHVVLAADTIVVIDGRVLGKPNSAEEAVHMLKRLSGQTHHVLTGVSIFGQNRNVCFFEKAEVTFFPLTDEEILAYVRSGEPSDKAGAYGIQGLGATLVEKISGDYFTIVGLPIARVVRVLKNEFQITRSMK